MGNHSRGGCVCQTLSLDLFLPESGLASTASSREMSKPVGAMHRGNLGGRRTTSLYLGTTQHQHTCVPAAVQGRSIGSHIYPFLRVSRTYPGSRAQKKTKPRNRWSSPGFGPNKVGQHPKSGRRRDDDGLEVTSSAATAIEHAHTRSISLAMQQQQRLPHIPWSGCGRYQVAER